MSETPTISTPALIIAMIDSGKGISDLLFSPGRPPQVERSGELVPIEIPGLPFLKPDDTKRIAGDLLETHAQAVAVLKEEGSCDFSYSLPDRGRFRVNVFRQRGSFAIVMRVIAPKIPTLEELQLPKAIGDTADLKNGIVLVTGPTGSGKSTTLAAIIDRINETRAEHILRSRIQSSSCTTTRKARCTSASCTATRRPSRWPCARRCARRRRSSWSARCATARPSRSR